MKRTTILLISAAFTSLLLLGCTDTEDSAPVGATVKLVSTDGEFIDMYEAPSSSPVVISNWPTDHECEVMAGPEAAGGITFWRLECEETGFAWQGWFDVSNLEVVD